MGSDRLESLRERERERENSLLLLSSKGGQHGIGERITKPKGTDEMVVMVFIKERKGKEERSESYSRDFMSPKQNKFRKDK